MPTAEEQAAQELSEAVDRAIRGLHHGENQPSEPDPESSKAGKGRKNDEETIVVQQRRRPSGRKK
jgi:hypothetical protein